MRRDDAKWIGNEEKWYKWRISRIINSRVSPRAPYVKCMNCWNRRNYRNQLHNSKIKMRRHEKLGKYWKSTFKLDTNNRRNYQGQKVQGNKI